MIFYTYCQYIGEYLYYGKGSGNRYLQNSSKGRFYKFAMEKYGIQLSIVLNFFETEKEAFEEEKFLIKNAREKGIKILNSTDGGEGSKGLIHSKESKLKISQSWKNFSDEKKKEILDKRIAKRSSRTFKERELSNLRISNALKGIKRGPFSEAHREKLRASHLGKSPGNKGVPKPSEEIKRRTSAWLLNKEQTVEKISMTLKGRKPSVENLENRKLAYDRRTPEQKESIRKKMCESQKRRRILEAKK